ncbi:uncharacterized protein V1510DRAFT_447110 [Dipodascopsis tothii]|uniref:uncharacterized protein n=1 Tax=Dipodascopsis tothii TaxID=44089 RepID=UPI0034CDBB4B
MDDSKRRRVALACNQCRVQKAKCDGTTPICSRCIASNQTCVYSDSTKKRGLPSGHAHEMELRAILLQRVLSVVFAANKAAEQQVMDLLADDSSPALRLDMTDEAALQRSWIESPASDLFEDTVKRLKLSYSTLKRENRSQNPLVGCLQLPRLKRDEPAGKATDDVAMPDASVSPPPTKVEPAAAAAATKPLLAPAPAPVSTPPLPPSPAPPPVTALAPPLTPVPALLAAPSTEESFSSMLSAVYPLVAPGSYALNRSGIVRHRSDASSLRYVGASSGLDSAVLGNLQRQIGASDVRNVPNLFDCLFGADEQWLARHQQALRILPLPSNSRALLNIYFASTHSWLPMVERYSLVRLVHSDPPVAADNLPDDFGLLWAIFALATAQVARSPDDRARAAEHAEYASYVLNAVPKLSTIGYIQALLLLGLLYMGRAEWRRSWEFVTRACHAALDQSLFLATGLGQDVSGPDAAAEATRRRTWAACGVLDTLAAARFGKLPTLRLREWDPVAVEADGWEEWDPWKAPDGREADPEPARCLSVFNELVRLTRVLNDVVTAGGCRPVAEPGWDPAAFFTATAARLADWDNALPAHCRLPDLGRSAVPYLLNLHLVHQLTRSLLQVTCAGPHDLGRRRAYTAASLRTSRLLCSAITEDHFRTIVPPTFEFFAFVSVIFTPQWATEDVNLGDLLQKAGVFLTEAGKVWRSSLASWQVLSLSFKSASAAEDEGPAVTPASTAASTADSLLSGPAADALYGLRQHEDATDLSMFFLKTPGDGARLEQFMQNLGYINGLGREQGFPETAEGELGDLGAYPGQLGRDSDISELMHRLLG